MPPKRHAPHNPLGYARKGSLTLTSLEIAVEVVKARGLDPNDPRAVSLIRKRVGACLFRLKAKALAQDIATVGPYKGWKKIG